MQRHWLEFAKPFGSCQLGVKLKVYRTTANVTTGLFSMILFHCAISLVHEYCTVVQL